MECDFQVGDPVVCISELTPLEQGLCGHRGPILDEVYHVREVAIVIHVFRGAVGVRVKEISLPISFFDQEMAFYPGMFRKLLTVEDFKSIEANAPSTRILEPV